MHAVLYHPHVHTSQLDMHIIIFCVLSCSLGPTVATLRDFCQMIWDVRTTMVVMVTKVVEGTKVGFQEKQLLYTRIIIYDFA